MLALGDRNVSFAKLSEQYGYQGKVGSDYVNDSSEPKNLNHLGFFAVSNPINKWRFAFSIAPDLRDEAYMNWSEPHITASTDTGYVEYQMITPQLSYEFSPTFFGSFGVNIVKAKAGRTLSAASVVPYSLSMEGDGTAYSYTAALVYRPYSWLLLTLAGTTEAVVEFHGTAEAKIDGTPKPSNVRIKMSVPGEYLASALLFLDETSHIYLSYKKWLYSTYKTSDLQFDDATLEAYFGTPSKRAWSDCDIYTIGAGKRFNNHALSIFGGWNNGGINLSTADFSSPPSSYRFGGGEYTYDFTKDWSIGGRYVYVRYLKERVNTPSLEGDFLQTSATFSSIYIQKRF